MSDVQYEWFYPTECGWLRRRDLETLKTHPNDIEIWEKPCGGLYAHSKRNGELVLKRLRGEEK